MSVSVPPSTTRRGHWRAEPWVCRAPHDAPASDACSGRGARARRRRRGIADQGHERATGVAACGRRDRASARVRLCRDRGRTHARHCAVRGGGQGDHTSALHELSPRRRRPDADRAHATAPAAGGAWRRWARRAGDDVRHLPPRRQLRSSPVCRDTRIGISRRCRWDGRGARCRRSASRSRIARATAAATWRPWSSIWPRTRSSAGRGRPAPAAHPRRAAQAEFGALVRAWAAAGGDCPPP